MLTDLFWLIALLGFVFWFTRRRGETLQGRLERAEAAIREMQIEIAGLRRGGPAAQAGSVADRPSTAAPPPEPQSQPPSGPSVQPPASWSSATPTSVPPVTPANDAGSPPEPSSAVARTQSLEERLGAHWSVLVGGLALALGGIFLVRYSIEAGLLGPGVRVALGALLSLALLGLGEKSRRGEILHNVPQLPAAHIPSVLTAAGTAVAFGTIYAAHGLYGFIGPAIAFLLLGAVALATMWSAILHGPALAALGLAGSYATPLLLTSDSHSPWPLLVYFAAVAIAAFLLARYRRWLWLAAVAVGGAVAWGIVFAFEASRGLDAWIFAAMLHAALQTGLAIFFMGLEPHAAVADEDASPDWIGTAALAALMLLIVMVSIAVPYSHGLWLPFTLAMSTLLAAAAWLSAPIAATAAMAGIVGLCIVLGWRGLAEPVPSSLLAPEMSRLLRLPENVWSYLLFSALSVVPAAAIAEHRLWRGRLLPTSTAAFYGLAATVPALAALALIYLRVTQFDSSIYFGCAGVAVAAVMALAADRFDRSERAAQANGLDPSPAYNLAAGAFAAAAIAAFSFALVASLSRGYLTVAFALSALGTAFVATRREIPLLRYAVAAIGLVVLARMAWDPRIAGDAIGTRPVFNWLLAGYGVPACAFALAAVLLRRRGEDLAVRLCDGLAVLFAGLLAFFEIHHAMSGGDIGKPVAGHVEQGLMAMTSLGFTYVLTRMDLARSNVVFRTASMAFAMLSLLLIAIGLGVVDNPLVTNAIIAGPKAFNTLVLAYLLPGLLTLLVARTARGVRPAWYVRTAAVAGILLLYGYVSLAVRHAFQGPQIGFLRHTTSAEVWGYTAAWLVLAVALLAYGFWRHSLEARVASGLLLAVVLVKLVLIDLADVSGFWRALSFICVGAVLVGIGRVYQRVLLARTTPPASGGGRSDVPGPA